MSACAGNAILCALETLATVMLSFEEALAHMRAAARPPEGRETVLLDDATGRVLAAPLHAQVAVPPADNAAMDGYAVCSTDIEPGGSTLTVSQRIPAGTVPGPLQPGTAARIFTGAPVPAGSDAVIMQEEVSVAGTEVSFARPPAPGQHIRRAGEDIAPGDRVLEAGTRLGAAHLGLAASLGVPELDVFRRLRVAVFFTGDELVAPGQPLAAGKLYNSNRPVLRSLLGALGCTVTDLGMVRDRLDETVAVLGRAAQGHDLVITSGGVSVGEEDHVRTAVASLGRLDLWKIAIKPGKPLAFGRIGEADFIGLPGNPVSALVTFLTLVRPFILRRQGCVQADWTAEPRVAGFEWPAAPGRREFLRARSGPDGVLALHPRQGSGVLSSCAWAEGLVTVAPGVAVRPGDTVSFLPFATLEGLR